VCQVSSPCLVSHSCLKTRANVLGGLDLEFVRSLFVVSYKRASVTIKSTVQ
jgi:hypothetical protein